MFNLKKLKKFIKDNAKGAISIMLCILVTPAVTVSSALVELHRYQYTASITQELIDSASLSTLADYDKYLDERFGLLALSQEADSASTFKNLLSENSIILGRALAVDSATVTPTLPLNHTDKNGCYNVLQKQIVDFSESTVMTDFLMSDLNIEDLLSKLFTCGGLDKVAGVASDMCDLIDGLEDFTDSMDTMVSNIGSVKTQVDGLVDKAETITNETYALYEKLNSSNFDINNADSSALGEIVKEYKEDIETIYNNIISLKDGANELVTTVKNLPSDFKTVQDKYDSLSDAIDGVMSGIDSASGESEKNIKSAGGKSVNTIKDTLKSVEDAMKEAEEQFESDLIDNISNAAQEFVQQLTSEFKLSKYSDDYFSVPLSDDAQSDLMTILKLMPSFVKDGDPTELKNAIQDIYIPEGIDFSSFSKTIENLKKCLEEMVRDVKQGFIDKMNDSMSSILTKLVNTIKQMFNLDGLYNDDLNAIVDAMAESNNPYQDLFDALKKIFDAVEEFKKIDKADTIGEKIKAVFTSTISAVKKLYEGAKLAITAVSDAITQMIDTIKRLYGYITGEKGSLYECLLLAAYMTKVLPSRINAGDTSVQVRLQDGTLLSSKTLLKGTSITGYDYSQIPVANSESVSSGKGLWDLMVGEMLGDKDAECFKGAELEYIMGGTSSEYTNQIVSFMNIYILRLLCDIPTVLTDPNVSSLAASASIACWVVYILEIFWDPLCDTILIVNDIPVDLFKEKCFLTPVGIPSLIKAVGTKAPGLEGILSDLSDGSDADKYEASAGAPGYSTYVLLSLMITVGEDKMVSRFCKIVEMEAKQFYKSSKGSEFNLSNTYTAINAEANVTFNSFLNVFTSNYFQKKIVRERSY